MKIRTAKTKNLNHREHRGHGDQRECRGYFQTRRTRQCLVPTNGICAKLVRGVQTDFVAFGVEEDGKIAGIADVGAGNEHFAARFFDAANDLIQLSSGVEIDQSTSLTGGMMRAKNDGTTG